MKQYNSKQKGWNCYISPIYHTLWAHHITHSLSTLSSGLYSCRFCVCRIVSLLEASSRSTWKCPRLIRCQHPCGIFSAWQRRRLPLRFHVISDKQRGCCRFTGSLLTKAVIPLIAEGWDWVEQRNVKCVPTSAQLARWEQYRGTAETIDGTLFSSKLV